MIEEYEDNYLENIIHGNEIKRTEDIATTARNYLCRSFQASKMAERKFYYFQRIKKEQELILEQLCTENNWWFLNLTQYNFLTEGGESKIYFKDKSNYVLKLNDAVYYNTWLDFLNNILLHNYYFPTTIYTLLGFTKIKDIFYAVLEQPFVFSNQITNLDAVKQFLDANGFINTKRFDYINPEIGIAIEDLHDENVLTVDDNLFFIDTIFLLK